MNVNNKNPKVTKCVLWVAALAIMAFPSIASADITWAAGAPGGTGGGSASFDQTAGPFTLSTGIVSDQLLSQRESQGGPAPAAGSDYTISYWFNRDGNTGEAWIIGSGDLGSGNFNTRGLHLGFNGAASNNLTQAHWSDDRTGSVLVSNTDWVHATYTFDADGGTGGTTGLGSLYVNGVLDSQGDQSGAFRDDGSIIIGSRVGGQGPNYDGRIDDLAFFTSALDATQVGTLFGDTTQALSLGAAAYYDFEDDQTGTTAAVQGTGLGAVALQGITAVPEPSSLAIMLGLGVAGLTRRKRS